MSTRGKFWIKTDNSRNGTEQNEAGLKPAFTLLIITFVEEGL